MTIPATSTPSERVFSVAGIVVDKRRYAFTVEIINALVGVLEQKQLSLQPGNELPEQSEPKLIPASTGCLRQ